jgi:hypothetical protein
VTERARLVYFPAIARQIPELRGATFFARLFLSRRSAAFDAALAGVAVSLVRRSPRPLLAALPWAWAVAAASRRWGRRAPRVAAAQAVADAVGAGALAIGSARARSLLI